MIVFGGESTDGGAPLDCIVSPWKGGWLFKAIVTTHLMVIADERQLSIHLSSRNKLGVYVTQHATYLA